MKHKRMLYASIALLSVCTSGIQSAQEIRPTEYDDQMRLLLKEANFVPGIKPLETEILTQYAELQKEIGNLKEEFNALDGGVNLDTRRTEIAAEISAKEEALDTLQASMPAKHSQARPHFLTKGSGAARFAKKAKPKITVQSSEDDKVDKDSIAGALQILHATKQGLSSDGANQEKTKHQRILDSLEAIQEARKTKLEEIKSVPTGDDGNKALKKCLQGLLTHKSMSRAIIQRAETKKIADLYGPILGMAQIVADFKLRAQKKAIAEELPHIVALKKGLLAHPHRPDWRRSLTEQDLIAAWKVQMLGAMSPEDANRVASSPQLMKILDSYRASAETKNIGTHCPLITAGLVKPPHTINISREADSAVRLGELTEERNRTRLVKDLLEQEAKASQAEAARANLSYLQKAAEAAKETQKLQAQQERVAQLEEEITQAAGQNAWAKLEAQHASRAGQAFKKKRDELLEQHAITEKMVKGATGSWLPKLW